MDIKLVQRVAAALAKNHNKTFNDQAWMVLRLIDEHREQVIREARERFNGTAHKEDGDRD